MIEFLRPGVLALLLLCDLVVAGVAGFVVFGVASLAVERGADDAVDDVDVDAAAAVSPREVHAQITVNNTTTTPLSTAARRNVSSGYCTVTDTVPVFKVAEGASSTSSGDGPYCTTCAAGPRIPLAGRAWARASSGTTTVTCSFVDDGVGFGGAASLGSGGSGGGVAPTDVCLLTGGADCLMTGGVQFAGAPSPQVANLTGDVDVRASTASGSGSVRLGGGAGGDGDVEVLDIAGNVDVRIGTSTSSSFGGIVTWVDTRTSLAASACDNVAELGSIVFYDRSASNSTSFCACAEVAGVIGWVAVSSGGDCAP